MVEADASDVGLGLSQRSALYLKLHPCDFFSHRLNTERNYDVGNRELLVVKMELEALAGVVRTSVRCVDR